MDIPVNRNDELADLKDSITATPVEVNLKERIMDRIEQHDSVTEQKTGVHRWRLPNKRFTAAAAALLSCALVFISTGFVSPVMAEAMKRIPGMDHIFQLAGDLGLKTADKEGFYNKIEASDTHEGLTLQAAAATYDGTRVAIAIKSSGESNADNLASAVNDVHLSINGEELKAFSSAKGNSVGLFMFHGQEPNSLILEFSDLSNQGGTPFPHSFNAALEFSVSGIKQPFQLQVPVQMNTTNNLVYNPGLTKAYQGIVFKIKRVELTPVTTTITTELSLHETVRNAKEDYGYDLFDEKGHKVELVSGNGWSEPGGNSLLEDTRFEPFESVPKSITIKPFKYLYKNEEEKTEFQLDDKGNIKVEYLPGLEVKLLLQK